MDDTGSAARLRAVRDRLVRIEDQLAILSTKAGVPYDKPVDDEVPANVRALAAAGRQMEAIQELRRQTDFSLVEAKLIVEKL